MLSHHRRRAVLLAGGAGLALLLAACGGPSSAASAPGGASAMPSMSMPATTDAAPAPGAVSSATAVTVTIQNFAFAPAMLTVRAGTTVTWVNRDQDAHTATARDKSFASPTLATGASFRFTFSKPGTYAYLCTIHPFMTATIVVTP